MLTKPKIGEPCNGCGLCCQMYVCHTGAFLLGYTQNIGEERIKGPCKALTPKKDGSFVCGLIENPNKWLGKSKYPAAVISKHVARLVGAGTGCDEIGHDEGNPMEEEKLDKMIEEMKNNPEWVQKATQSVNFIQNLMHGK